MGTYVYSDFTGTHMLDDSAVGIHVKVPTSKSQEKERARQTLIRERCIAPKHIGQGSHDA